MKRLALHLFLAVLLVGTAALAGPWRESAKAQPAGVADQEQVRAAQVAEIGGEATLRAAFNRDKGKVRLLMILSPT